jgi:peptidoglycan/xylan/chitin deacetylase (PgdA/CDA1 family)
MGRLEPSPLKSPECSSRLTSTTAGEGALILQTASNVLMYHDVVPGSDPDASGFPGPGPASFKVAAVLFEQHLDAIAARTGSRNVPVACNGPPHSSDSCCLTFDDGGVSAIEYIAGSLERRGWRGLFFITADRIGQPGFLSQAQVVELRLRGHTVGSHSLSHPERLAASPRELVRAEWSESVAILSDILSERVVLASVPNGSYNRTVGEEADAAGVRALFTSEPTRRRAEVGGCTVIGRYNVRANTRAAWVAAVATGARVPRYAQWLEWNLKRVTRLVAGRHFAAMRQLWLMSRR